jgi:glycosyltransferase involved in cell wall biosynthesis
MRGYPSVAVVIPTYNSCEYLIDALESVIHQTFQPDEVIVVDDGSTDSTRERLVPYLGRITYLRQSNSGPARARNLAIDHTRCEWITFLDSDDYWNVDKLALQMECARQYPAVSQIGTRSNLAHDVVREGDQPTEFLSPRDFLGPLPFGISSLMARRDKLHEVGLFNVTHWCAAEDRELILKLSLTGLSMRLNRPLWTYRLHAQQGSLNVDRMVSSYSRVLDETIPKHPQLKEFAAFAYGYHHYDAAFAYHEAGRRWQALRHLTASFIRHPQPFSVGHDRKTFNRLLLAPKFLCGDRWLRLAGALFKRWYSYVRRSTTNQTA